MLITRQLRRFVARLLVGALVYAQLALSAYACPPLSSGAMDLPDAAIAASVMLPDGQDADAAPALTVHMDSVQPELCAAHCQSAHQNIEIKPAPSPVLALLASYFTLDPKAQGVGHARPAGMAASPPPKADPPHAILHCCFRI